jgi:tetratricopeptide (TPR) repeat protein
MEQMAMPGSILITAATLAPAEGYVGVKPLGPVPVKGLNELIEVFELTGAGLARTRLQAAAARGLTRFVGRETEVHAVREGLERARGGHGQLIALVGEPGVGTSRLVWEFAHSHRTHGWLVLESSSVSYGKTTAFLPVINLLKAYFQIEERDDARKIRERVTGKLLTLDQALAATLPAFLALLDVSADDPDWQALEPSQRRQQTLDAIKRLVLRESQIQPLLLVFEDLHWIDGESQALIDSLVEGLPSAHVLLLVNFRPEYEHRWGGKTYYTQLRLDPLPPASARELLQSLLGEDAGIEPLKPVLIERTEGNPFFLEESVRTLIETKVLAGERGAYRLARALPEIHVPATVQAILAARIDRLLPDEKRLLQSAAVVGKDVPFALLALVADASEEELRRALAHLQAAEFIYETRIFPDLEYTFKHALTHEVAYESLLHDRRRTLHAAVVAAIERLHPGRLAEHAEHLAHHARQAEIWDKAGRYLWEAGRKAFTRSANREAADYFEHAAAAIDRLPQTRETLEQAIDVRFELRTALQVLRAQDRQETCLADALIRAETLGDQRRLGYTLMFAGLRATLVEDLDEGLRLGDRALAIGRSLGDLGIQAGASCYLAIAHLFAGRFAEAARLCEAAIVLIPPERTHERFGQARMVANLARGTLGNALGRQGRFSDGIAHAEEALKIARDAGQAYSLRSSLWELGVLHLLKGDHAAAAREIEQSIEVWRTIEAPALNHPIQALALVYCRRGGCPRGSRCSMGLQAVGRSSTIQRARYWERPICSPAARARPPTRRRRH